MTGTGQASGTVPYWELVVMRNSFDGITMFSTPWCYPNATATGRSNGSNILNYASNQISYFTDADKSAMKLNGSVLNTNDYSSDGTGSKNSSYLWPISYTEALPIKDYLKSKSDNQRRFTRSLSSPQYAWAVDNYYGLTSNNHTYIEGRVAICFNLDLAKVLLGKTATKDSTSESITYVGTKISEDLKFLINTGTVKASSFTINKKGEYTGAVTTTINGGTNYISEIIYDSTGKSLYYGNLGTVSSSSGSVELTIPDGIASGTYTLAVFEEEKCDAYKTDYACTPVYFSFTV